MEDKILDTESGNSLLEILVVLMILAIMLNGMMSNLIELNRPLYNANAEVAHFLRLARSTAISQTRFIHVEPVSAYRVQAYTADGCDETPTIITELFLDLPDGSNFSATDWDICFTPRGLSEEEVTFQLQDTDSATKTVEVALGGGTRTL